MTSLRVLIVADELEPALQIVAAGLADRGHHVRLLGNESPDCFDPTMRFRAGDRLRVEQQPKAAGRMTRYVGAGREVLQVAVAGRRSALQTVAAIRGRFGEGPRFGVDALTALQLLAGEVDVVYFESATVAVRYTAVLRDVAPVVVRCTGSDIRVQPFTNVRLREALPHALGAAVRVLCASAELATWAVRHGARPERVEVVYAPVDQIFFRPPDPALRRGNQLRLLSVGRLHWVKAYHDALQAVHLARQDGHDVTYTIIGQDEGERDALRFAVADLGLSQDVHFAPRKSQPGVRAAMARSHALVMSSVSEGASRAAMEAMAMGLPVVTTAVGGMAEIVEDGVTGLLVPPRQPAALASALARLAVDPAQRERMGHAAAARATRFEAARYIDGVERALQAR